MVPEAHLIWSRLILSYFFSVLIQNQEYCGQIMELLDEFDAHAYPHPCA